MKSYYLLAIACMLSLQLGSKDGFTQTKTQSVSSTSSLSANASAAGSNEDFSKEDLFTGTAAFSVPITSLGGVNVALSYSSNVHKLVRASNKNQEAGWVGLGWSLNLGSIVGDINGTKDVSDDHYYYVSASGSSELVQITDSTFALKDYQYWKIVRKLNGNGYIVGWKIVTQNGTIMRFGNYDKSNGGNFQYGYGGTNATRYSLGWGGLVTNPLNTYFSDPNHPASLIPYEWDLSDVQDVAGNHTTISYQPTTNVLSVGNETTDSSYTQESYPLSVTDRSGRTVKFILANLTPSEYVAPPDQIIQRQVQTKYLDSIEVCNSNGSIVQSYYLGYAVNDIFATGDSKRFLTSITELDANHNSLPSTSFSYYTSATDINPGALDQITYPDGGTVQYTYQRQQLTDLNLNYSAPINASNPPTIGAFTQHWGMSGSDFYAVQLQNHALQVFRWGTTGWYPDSTFPVTTPVYSYQVFGDYIVLKTSSTNIEVVRRQDVGWTSPYSVVLNQAGSKDSVVTAQNNFFIVAHNPTGSGNGTYCNFTGVVWSGGHWETQYIDSVQIGSAGYSNLQVVSGTNYFALRLWTPSTSYVTNAWSWNGVTWHGATIAYYEESSPFFLYGGPDYFLALGNWNNNNGYWQSFTVWNWDGTEWQDTTFSVTDILHIYTGNNFFLVQCGPDNFNSLLLYTWNGNSNNSGWVESAINSNENFDVAVGNRYFVVSAFNYQTLSNSTLTLYTPASRANGTWNSQVLETRDLSGSSLVAIAPLISNSTLYVEWYKGQYYQAVDAYTSQFGNWKVFGTVDSNAITGDEDSFTQPGDNFVADLVQGNSGMLSRAFEAAADEYGSPLFSGSPYDYPISSKTVSDGMGNTYTTNFTFSNGVYDDQLDNAEYNEATVTSPGNNGKTVTYFYNKLGPGQAGDFVNVPSYLNLDGYPYKTKIYNHNNTVVDSTTNYWSANQIDGLPGVYYQRLDRVQVMKDGDTTSTSYAYDNSNGQVSETIKRVYSLYGSSLDSNLVTSTTFAYEQYSSMKSANMLVQPYETTIASASLSTTSVSVSSSETTSPHFTPAFTQTVSFKYTCTNGTVKIGTSSGGSGVFSFSGSTGGYLEGTFTAQAGTTYYISASPSTFSPITASNASLATSGSAYLIAYYYPGQTLSISRTEYDANNFAVRTLESIDGSTSNWDTTSVVASRDSYGNITESIDAAGMPTTVQYGYNGTLPIGEIVDGTSTTSAVATFDDGTSDGWTYYTGGQSGTPSSTEHTGNYGWYMSGNVWRQLGRKFTGLDLSGVYTFSGWVLASSYFPDVTCQIEYNGGTSDTTITLAEASGTGSWQHLSGTINLSNYPNVDYIVVTAQNGNGIELDNCYWDDIRFGPSDALISTTGYDPNTLQVAYKTDANDVTTYYQYDTFGRPSETLNDDGAVLSKTAYHYARSGHGGSLSSTNPNYVQTETYPDGTSSTPLTTLTYTDGLGRVIQVNRADGDSCTVSATEFDAAGRPYRSWKSFKTSSQLYDASYSSDAVSYYGFSNPYTETDYYADPLSRVETTIPPGATSSNEDITTSYGSATFNGDLLSYTQTQSTVGSNTGKTDSRVYVDNLGQTVRTETYEDGSSSKDTSVTYYDMSGNPVKSVDPDGHVSTSEYDFLGRLVKQTNVDNGTSQYLYDKAGRLRFMMDADGASTGNILYWKYDDLGRVIEKGYSNGFTWATAADSVNNEAYPSTPSTWREKYVYDDASITPYAMGRLCEVQTNNGGTTSPVTEEFIYDKYGDIVTKTTTVPDYSSDSYGTDYTYDNLGRVTKIVYPLQTTTTSAQNVIVPSSGYYSASSATSLTVGPSFTVESGGTATVTAGQKIVLEPGFRAAGGSTFLASIGQSVTYSYNQLGQITGVGNVANPDYYAAYTYKADGTVNEENLNNSSLPTTYSYNNLGFLRSISTPGYFSETLSDSNGYDGYSYYDGSIASDSYSYGSGGPSSYAYTFAYDHNNRLTSAENTVSSSNSYGTGTSPITYDYNGNITGGANMPALTYGGSDIPTGPGGLQHDNDGNITGSHSDSILVYYDQFTLLPRSETINNAGTWYYNFEYDGRKERVLSTYYRTTTLYLRGINTYPLEQQSSTGTIDYIYGPTGLVALVDGGQPYFVLKDHLGSTREVLAGNNSPVAWYDYTPSGKIWRSTVNHDVAYKFTGQKLDVNSGLYNFHARMYDPTLGIFYASDPANQDFSPYMYCGGNPISFVDPTGMRSYDGMYEVPTDNIVIAEAPWWWNPRYNSWNASEGLPPSTAADLGYIRVSFAGFSGSQGGQSQVSASQMSFVSTLGFTRPSSPLSPPTAVSLQRQRLAGIIQNLTPGDKTLLTGVVAAGVSPYGSPSEEVSGGTYTKEMAGVMFTVFNRLAAGGYGTSIRGVINYPNAYSEIRTAIYHYALHESLMHFKKFSPYQLGLMRGRIDAARIVLKGIISGTIRDPIGNSKFYHSTLWGQWNSAPWNEYLDHVAQIYNLGNLAVPPGWHIYHYGNTVFLNWYGLR